MDKIFLDTLHACADNADRREYWVELAQSCLDEKDFLGGYWAITQALKITEKKPDDDPNCWSSWPYDIGATCAYYVGLYKEARNLGINAWRLLSNDHRVILNLKLCRRRLNEYAIHLLWPTVRPSVFKERHKDWISKAANPDRIKTLLAVNTKEQEKKLCEFDTIVIGDQNPGVAFATHKLARAVKGLPGDIIILASDDFYPPEDWDTWIHSHLNNFYGVLLVNDSVNRPGVVTIPIMDYACLTFTNRIIYHPSYCHLYSDNEYYDNLYQQNLIKILQGDDYPLFEHKHWYHGKREKDKADDVVQHFMESDRQNYENRRGLSLQEKLCYQT